LLIAAHATLFLPFLGQPWMETARWVLFVALIAILFLIRSAVVVRGIQRISAFFILFLGAAGIRLLSTAWSPDPIYTFMRGLSLIFLAFLVAYLVEMIVSSGQLRVINTGIIIWIALLILPGLVLYAAGVKTVPFSEVEMELGVLNRYSGILGNPNQIAICGAVMGPLVLAAFLERRQWWLLAVYIAILASVYLSGSRSGALAQIAAIVAVPAFANRQLWPSIIIVGLLGLSLLHPSVRDGAKDFFARGNAETIEEIGANRTSRWTEGFKSIMKRPLLGQGYGIGGMPLIGAHPTEIDRGYPLHNSFMQLLQENGILGAIPVVGILVGLGLSLLKRGKNVHPTDRWIYAGFASAVLCGLVSSLFESWLLSVGNLGTLPFWICCAVVWLLANVPAPNHRTGPRIVPAPGWDRR
jgi:O-antigen ligase